MIIAPACGGSDGLSVGIDATEPPPGGPVVVTPDTPVVPADDVDLRADTNRDGVVSFTDPTDDDGEDRWDEHHGAIFLANIDDDEEKCTTDDDDITIAKCNDAADEVVNGDDDLLDLARLATKPWAGATEGGRISWTAPTFVRLFKKSAAGKFEVIAAGAQLSIDEIKAGVELAIEARDIVRDRAMWDGTVSITLEVGGKSDVVVMRVSPLMTYHHLEAAETTWVASMNSAGNVAMRNDLATAATAAGVPAPRTLAVTDQWTQDYFETGFMSMPGANGAQHAMRVNIRSANESNPQSTANPLRRAGRVVYTLRGKDSAAVQQYDPARKGQYDTLNSFGNLETIPPHSFSGASYPLGRILRGNVPDFHPDNSFLHMMEDQSVQKPLYVDTSFLLVGHVDETMSFVKASSPRGWVMLMNDPMLAKTMLEAQQQAGNGAVKMFVGKSWGQSSAEVSINEVLADADVMGASSEAAAGIDAQREIVVAATGLQPDEIVKIPYLHMPSRGGSVAYQPGMLNGLYLSDKHFVAPDPHGPMIEGKDIFKAAMIDALAPYGIEVHFAEDWDLYHRQSGEVHCGTNATRAIPDTKWWETGR